MKNTNVSVWKINESLEEVLVLLQKDYTNICEKLRNYNINPEEKLIVNKWESYDGQAWEIKTIEIQEKKYSYIHCKALMEVNSISDFGIKSDDDNPLPKRIRANIVSSEVFFIENIDSVYVITLGSKSNEGKIRKNLMDSRKKQNESRWQKIVTYGIPEFTFEKSFYYWLLHNKGNEFVVNGNKLKLDDVRGFKSNAERSDIAYNGEGSNIDTEIPLKSLVSMNQELISLYLHIKYNDNIEFQFYIDCDGRLGLYEIACGKFCTDNPGVFTREECITYIYFFIIPFLRESFNNDIIKNNWQTTENNFKKKLSIDIILELIRENNVYLCELEQAMDEASNI